VILSVSSWFLLVPPVPQEDEEDTRGNRRKLTGVPMGGSMRTQEETRGNTRKEETCKRHVQTS
jgi:hypothetical protein